MLCSKGYPTDSFLLHRFNLMLYTATYFKHEMLHPTNISFTDTVSKCLDIKYESYVTVRTRKMTLQSYLLEWGYKNWKFILHIRTGKQEDRGTDWRNLWNKVCMLNTYSKTTSVYRIYITQNIQINAKITYSKMPNFFKQRKEAWNTSKAK